MACGFRSGVQLSRIACPVLNGLRSLIDSQMYRRRRTERTRAERDQQERGKLDLRHSVRVACCVDVNALLAALMRCGYRCC